MRAETNKELILAYIIISKHEDSGPHSYAS